MDIAQTIRQRAQERGVDPELALAIAKAESGLRPQIKNPKSSAHGLFQIVDDTWKQYGGDPKKRKDVNENIRIGLEILADNQQALAATLGRAPRPGELYAGHFFGKAGAQRVLTANPDAPVSSVVSARVLKANPELLQGKSVSQALFALSAKVGDTGPGQRVPRAPDPKTARPAYREDPAKPPVISNAIDATNQYGPGYQAALALSYLADTEEESDDPDAPSVVEREARAEIEEQQAAAAAAAPRAPRASDMLAQMDFGYAPVVGQPQAQAPVKMADGGLLQQAARLVPLSRDARNKYESARAKWEAFSKQGESYNAALNSYNREVMGPYSAQVAAYNKALDEWNAGPRTSDFTRAVPRPSSEFTMAAPKEPNTLSPEQMDNLMSEAQKRRAMTAQALNVAADPSQFGLSMPALFNQGGEVMDRAPARSKALEALYGAGETALTLGTGAAASLAGMPYGLYKGLTSGQYLQGKAADIAGKEAAAFMARNTYQPRSESARENLAALGRAVEPLKLAPTPGGAAIASLARPTAVRAQAERLGMEAEKSVAPAVTSTMERGGKAAELLQALSPAPAQAMPGKVGAPAKPAAFTPLPTAEAPFVGRLDQFAAGMQSPMKKEQLLGTLKGKFKDYEIERARVALQDLPDDAKVMSTDFLNRLNEVHNPAGFRTTVLEPKQGGYYQSMDNVFVDGANTPPMGVIHLTKFVDPSAAARFEEVSRADSQLLTLSRGGNMWGSKLDTDAVEKWADSQPDGFHIKNLLNSTPVQQAKEFSENMSKAQDAADFLLFPGIGKAKIPDIPYPRDAEGAIDFVLYDRLKDEAAQQVRQQGKDMWRALGITSEVPPDPPGLYHRMAFTDQEYKDTILGAMREYKDQMRVKAQDAVYPVMDDLGRLRERVAAEGPYMGQHSSLENAPMPISFSRYTEREAVIPGMGKAKGIYVHELQSDLLDDVRKKGAKGGSETKDYAELKKVEEKLANRYGMDDSEVFSLLGRRKVLEQRLDRGPYTAEAGYRLEEAIPNMEQSPQVVQQLMVKNAVSAAIQRGDQFVAFPGKESAQAQLYEKLPRNLDAVVKDLGPGFEKRSIEMTLPNGEPAMFNAIVWAPEAAQKLQKSGIPFAKGGMVERNNHDNRSYK